MTEALMIRRMANGDEEAFDYCYNTYKNLIYYEAFRITKNAELSEEIMQDTFLKMYQNISSFDGRYFTAWIVTICKNLSLNEIRKKKDDIPFDETVYNNEYVVSTFAFNDMIMDLNRILSQDEFDIIIYRIVYHIKYEDIAKIYDTSVGAISGKYNYAMKKAKKYFKEEVKNNESKKTNNE